MKQSVQALLSRAFDSDLAKSLVSQGYNITKLKQMTAEQLSSLGIGKEQIENVHSGARPPIEPETVNKLLWESRFTCCVCRVSGRPIIIHHVDPWEKSRSHAEENLVILCVQCHDKAHSKHQNSLNLTEDRIKAAKSLWLEEVKKNDIEISLGRIQTNSIYWDYFNLHRLYELLRESGIQLAECDYFEDLYGQELVDENGNFIFKNFPDKKAYWLDFHAGVNVNGYLKSAVTQLVARRHFKLLDNIWSKSGIHSILRNNDLVILTGAFYFKNKSTEEKPYECFAYRKAKGIMINFNIDKFYCNSTSSKENLSRKRVVTVLAKVREIGENDYGIAIRCTALAIATGAQSINLIVEEAHDEEFEIVNHDYLEEMSDEELANFFTSNN